MLILVSERDDDIQFGGEVATAAKLNFKHAKSPKEAVSILGKAKGDAMANAMILADLSQSGQLKDFQDALSTYIGKEKNKVSPNNVHFIGAEHLSEKDLLGCFNMFGHFIIRNYGDPKEAGRHYGRIVQGYRGNDEIKVSSLLSDSGSIRIIKLKNSTEKSAFIDQVREYLSNETSFVERSIFVIINAVDELLMNAIYDAPTTQSGKEKYSMTLRDTPIDLEGQQSVELQMGYDGEYVAFTVVDRFGSVNKTKLLSKVFASYMEEEYQVDLSRAGAGLGLATTFRTGGSLLIYSKPKEKTAVTVFFKQTENYRDFKKQFKFISVHISS
jgi:hypothetical protein